MSLSNRITNYFAEWYTHTPDKWINGGEIERLALSIGFKASNASRRLRELRNDGVLVSKIQDGSVWYKYNI